LVQDIHHHTFSNGLTLLAERMAHVRSAAVNILIPAGCAYDPPGRLGVASALADLITRGAGSRDSRSLTQALDQLGLSRSESVGTLHIRFWGATLARNLAPALEIYADILRRPHLPADQMEAVKSASLQELAGLEDEPRSKVLLEVRRRFFPPPLGRDHRGTLRTVERLTIHDVRKHYRRHFHPQGAILAVAGNVNWESLFRQVEALFGDWQGDPTPTLKLSKPPRGYRHVAKDTQQTQIAIAYPSVPVSHPDFYAAQGAVQVLSGGMSSRLFTEVREKKGLCYEVSASYSLVRNQAAVICYAGTKNDRAQETLDVTVQELHRLREGITEEEVARMQASVKSSLVMQQESTSSRAGSLASDWYYLGRVRPLDEIAEAIDRLTPQRIVDHLRRFPPKDFAIVTLGPKPLKRRWASGELEPGRRRLAGVGRP
jgi:predicted Zn-dependent peptidase